jgi:hypothetical protein
LLAAAPPLVDPKIGDGQLLHGIEDEVHNMTGRYPFDSAQGPDHSRKSYGRNIGVSRSKSTKRAGILVGRTIPFYGQNFLCNIRTPTKRRPPFV